MEMATKPRLRLNLSLFRRHAARIFAEWEVR